MRRHHLFGNLTNSRAFFRSTWGNLPINLSWARYCAFKDVTKFKKDLTKKLFDQESRHICPLALQPARPMQVFT